jgi:hypothetical protein
MKALNLIACICFAVATFACGLTALLAHRLEWFALACAFGVLTILQFSEYKKCKDD